MARSTALARGLRRNATDVEKRLWRALKEASLPWRFRRQHPIGRRVADFACPARKLVVELDGGQHGAEIDADRSAEIEGRGFRIIRFWNNEVIENLQGVLDVIRRELEVTSLLDKPFSALQGGEGFGMRWEEEPASPPVPIPSLSEPPPHPTLSPLKGGEGSSGIGAADFASLMAALGPFERSPHLAVAVSGGSDSLALTLLADRWAGERGGRVTALTVDHGLRAESAEEALRVADWLAARGIGHRILRWNGPYPIRGRQAAARAARYRLLEEACTEAGILHLLIAHHLEDQAETFLLRLARGSGLDGLAGMAPVIEHAGCRLLRPLLLVPRERLAATLQIEEQPWIEDPSNRNPAYARVRLRGSAAVLGAEGLTPLRLAETAQRLARARAAIEDAVARCLVHAVALYPSGFGILRPDPLTDAPREVGLRTLAALIATIGGSDYPPRLDRLERLYDRLAKGTLGQGATLGGCRILPRRGEVLVCREPSALAAPVVVVPGSATSWDGRFELKLPDDGPSGLMLGALGGDAPALARACGKAAQALVLAIPGAVRPSLPALRDLEGIVTVPHLRYVRSGMKNGFAGEPLLSLLSFRPTRPLSSAGFTVV